MSDSSIISLSGIQPAGKPAFRLQGKLLQSELRRKVRALSLKGWSWPVAVPLPS